MTPEIRKYIEARTPDLKLRAKLYRAKSDKKVCTKARRVALKSARVQQRFWLKHAVLTTLVEAWPSGSMRTQEQLAERYSAEIDWLWLRTRKGREDPVLRRTRLIRKLILEMREDGIVIIAFGGSGDIIFADDEADSSSSHGYRLPYGDDEVLTFIKGDRRKALNSCITSCEKRIAMLSRTPVLADELSYERELLAYLRTL